MSKTGEQTDFQALALSTGHEWPQLFVLTRHATRTASLWLLKVGCWHNSTNRPTAARGNDVETLQYH